MCEAKANRFVFLDINSINSTSFDVLFGRNEELARLCSMAQIVIPKTVLDELLEHKKRYFHSKMKEVSNNPLLRLASVNHEAFRKLDYNTLENRLLNECQIEYEVAEIHDFGKAFQIIYDLALRNEAPFEKGSDKGFKDACIVLAVDDYLAAHPDAEEVVVVSDDSRIRDYYNNSSIHCVSDINSAIKSLSRGFGTRRNNDVVETQTGDFRCSVTAQNQASQESVESLISSLSHSGSFAETHEIIGRYSQMDFTQVGSRARENILNSCIRNDPGSYILSDDDVYDFVFPVFKVYQHFLSDADYSFFVDAAGLPNERVDDDGNIQLSRSEKIAYNNFTRDLLAHVQSRDYKSAIVADADKIERDLCSLSPKQNIDESAVSWQNIADVFIKGGVKASSSPVNPKVLRDFLSLLHQGSKEKKDAIISVLRLRLEDVEEVIPF